MLVSAEEEVKLVHEVDGQPVKAKFFPSRKSAINSTMIVMVKLTIPLTVPLQNVLTAILDLVTPALREHRLLDCAAKVQKLVPIKNGLVVLEKLIPKKKSATINKITTVMVKLMKIVALVPLEIADLATLGLPRPKELAFVTLEQNTARAINGGIVKAKQSQAKRSATI